MLKVAKEDEQANKDAKDRHERSRFRDTKNPDNFKELNQYRN